MFECTQKLLAQVAHVVQAVPNVISFRGRNDSVPFDSGGDYTNWELSSDRANSSRRVLEANNVAAERLNNVVGKAATEPLLPDDTTNARNRRISITLLREELTNPEAYQKRVEALAKEKAAMMESSDNSEGTTPGETPTTDRQDAPSYKDFDPYASPSIPAPESSGDFKRTDGAVQFP